MNGVEWIVQPLRLGALPIDASGVEWIASGITWLGAPDALGQEELLTQPQEVASEAQERRELSVIEKVVIASFVLSLVSFLYNVHQQKKAAKKAEAVSTAKN